ncbi:exosome complex component RRP40 [Aplysia californica]|uniref:Ribosomal RNA-processing protein 40 n=1 Tax=Aplysia californica TaxID=6500 RepID=A0ABM0JUB4_APLCA|nr:exosome complex component RRP40 [Aplysia californica]
MADKRVGNVFMPGDVLEDLQVSESVKKIVLGPGLIDDGNRIKISKPGILRFREPGIYWIDCHQKRYVPSKGDSVIGIITQKAGDIFRVDIGGSEQASLSYLSFEGATKRNRPDVKVGDIVYAKLLVANKDMEPEVVCIDSYGRSSGMGVIRNGGFLFNASLNLVRKLLSPQCALVKSLGHRFQFELAVGLNGRVWAKSKSDIQTIAMANGIMASEFMDNNQIKAMCKRLSRAVSGMEVE